MPESVAEKPKSVQETYTAILQEIDRQVSPLDITARQRVYRLVNTTLTERVTAADRARHEMLHGSAESRAQPP